MSRYRHEYKYILNSCQESILKLKLDGMLSKDRHVGACGFYTINSLYFDDYSNTCYYENENGTDPRAKYRIRYYDDNTTRLSLEKKMKKRGMTLKQSVLITREECMELMSGKIPNINDDMSELKKQLFTEMLMKNMKPKVIVSYERIPYVYSVGNVRVTLDRNITSSDNIKMFLAGGFFKRPILPKGQNVLEVKWDEVLPAYIKNGMKMDNLQWTAFSKYYLCRKYSTNGGLKI
ncbi:MAG: polyphosphate polymerase domain-containing protein [Lachnospiraceae bacterium]|nr:polyphosphate polymerase domain-containing protein [Lachnospiraceae bacterium]